MANDDIRFIYRCEKCDIVIYNRTYYKNEICPYCNEKLKIIQIEQNSKLIDLVKNVDMLNYKMDLFKKEIPRLNNNDIKQLFCIVDNLFNELDKFRQLTRSQLK